MVTRSVSNVVSAPGKIVARTRGHRGGAIDFLYNEWTNKAAGFISYGGTSGVRAVENLRLVMAELQVATVRAQVGLSMFTDFENFSVFKPVASQEQNVNNMLDQVISWASALKTLRRTDISSASV